MSVAASPQLSPSVVATDPDEQAGQNSSVPVEMNGEKFSLRHGSVVIAAITSCTNTSNPERDARGRAAGAERGGEGTR